MLFCAGTRAALSRVQSVKRRAGETPEKTVVLSLEKSVPMK